MGIQIDERLRFFFADALPLVCHFFHGAYIMRSSVKENSHPAID